jgi:hypothetical protein
VACTTNGAEKVKTLLSLKKRTFILCLLSNKQIRRLPPSSSKSFIHDVAMPSGGALEAMASRHHLLSPVIERFSVVPAVLGARSSSFSRICFGRTELLFLTDSSCCRRFQLCYGFRLSCLCRSGFRCRFCVLLTKSVFCLFVSIVLYRSGVLQFFVDLVFLCIVSCFCLCVHSRFDFIIFLFLFCERFVYYVLGWLCCWFCLRCWLVRCGCEMGWSRCLELLRWSMCLELPLMYLVVIGGVEVVVRCSM